MHTRRLLLAVLVFTLLVGPGAQTVSAQDAAGLWPPWVRLDPAALDDDGTGTRFALDAVNGAPALRITPGGRSEETKLAYPVTGEDLEAWADSAELELDVFLPETHALNPNTFFLGLADVSGAWAWVGGVFGTPSGDSGWITVTFSLDDALRHANPDGRYIVYLSFFHQGTAGKPPLSEPFYLGAVHLSPGASGAVSAADARNEREAAALLALDDGALIDAVARETFDYFWLEASPETGLIRDRSSASSPASIAAIGFGLAAIPAAVDRGWITAEEGYERVETTLQTFLNGGVEGEHGFYYHFVDMSTGERAWNSELSSIDTALLAAGALIAGQYFAGTDVEALAVELYERIDWDWMRAGGEFVRMGWTPEDGFLNAAWDHFDESLLLYVLAIGSPTHPIPASVWDAWARPIRGADESITLPGDPLFVYQYPLAFLDLQGLEDAYANYWNNAIRACQRNHAATASSRSPAYAGGVWGLSASDGPNGYRAYGAADANHDGTIAPYASAACLPLTPELALDGMRALLTRFGGRVWGEYGFVSAVNAAADWYSTEHIGIDQGDILLMLTNSQDGFVWELLMANRPVQAALEAMGFVESAGDYAVTPAYWAERMGS